MVIVVSDELEKQVRQIVRTVLRTPFTRRTWNELGFLLIGAALAGVSFAFVALTMAAGTVLAITFFGLELIGLSLRATCFI